MSQFEILIASFAAPHNFSGNPMSTIRRFDPFPTSRLTRNSNRRPGSLSNVRHGVGESQPSRRTAERPAQQYHRGHHGRADQPNGMWPAAGAPVVDYAGDDHEFEDQT